MSPTKTDDRDQWRARILRALDELQPADKPHESMQLRDESPDAASAAE